MRIQRFHGEISAGFLLSLVALVSYPFIFVRFPVTRDFPWVNLLLFGIAEWLLFRGLQRAFVNGQSRASKVVGAVLATLGIVVLVFFVFAAFILPRRLPASRGAPQIGQKAPDFTLADTTGRSQSLSELLRLAVNGKPPKGVLLVFYRGYW